MAMVQTLGASLQLSTTVKTFVRYSGSIMITMKTEDENDREQPKSTRASGHQH
jgi:hypothetical protein